MAHRRKPRTADEVAISLVRQTYSTNVYAWRVALAPRGKQLAAVRWDAGKINAAQWRVTLRLGGVAQKRSAQWRIDLPLDQWLADGESHAVPDLERVMKAVNTWSRRLKRLPTLPYIPKQPTSVNLRILRAYQRAFEAAVVPEQAIRDDVVRGSLARTRAILRGLGWLRSHHVRPQLITLRTNAHTRLLSPDGVALSRARFTARLGGATDVIATWSTATPHTDLLKTVPSSIQLVR